MKKVKMGISIAAVTGLYIILGGEAMARIRCDTHQQCSDYCQRHHIGTYGCCLKPHCYCEGSPFCPSPPYSQEEQ